MTELTVTLPDELARQIRAAGLLDKAALEKVFTEALRKQAVGAGLNFLSFRGFDEQNGRWRRDR